MRDNEVKERVERLKVEEKIDSDHQPIKIWTRRDEERKIEEKKIEVNGKVENTALLFYMADTDD